MTYECNVEVDLVLCFKKKKHSEPFIRFISEWRVQITRTRRRLCVSPLSVKSIYKLVEKERWQGQSFVCVHYFISFV